MTCSDKLAGGQFCSLGNVSQLGCGRDPGRRPWVAPVQAQLSQRAHMNSSPGTCFLLCWGWLAVCHVFSWSRLDSAGKAGKNSHQQPRDTFKKLTQSWKTFSMVSGGEGFRGPVTSGHPFIYLCYDPTKKVTNALLCETRNLSVPYVRSFLKKMCLCIFFKSVICAGCPRRESYSPDATVTGGCGPSDRSVGNRTPVLWKGNKCC